MRDAACSSESSSTSDSADSYSAGGFPASAAKKGQFGPGEVALPCPRIVMTPNDASAAAASSASTHPKDTSMRDAACSSESSSTSDSADSFSAGGFPASAAKKGQFGPGEVAKPCPRAVLAPNECGKEVQFGWGDVQMPCAASWATGEAIYSLQLLPPQIRDSRFHKHRHLRVYICDGCNAHVPWCGQAKGFDGAYYRYDNKTQIEFLPRLWEQGQDFRWYCTMCYAKSFREDDLSKVRERIGLNARMEKRQARTQAWRKTNRDAR